MIDRKPVANESVPARCRNWHLYQDRRIKSPSAMLRLIGQRILLPKATNWDAEFLMDQVEPGGGQAIIMAEDQIDRLMAHPESARVVEFREVA
jgi:hypothetical protein